MNPETLIKLQAILGHRRVVLTVVIALSSVLMLVLAFRSRDIEKSAVLRPALRVEALKIEKSSERVVVSGFGTVEPSKLLELRPQVSGHVRWIHSQLKEGGRIPNGEALVRIDPRDYEIAVDAKRADVAHAESDLKIEQGNQRVAQHEWKLFKEDGEKADSSRELTLRLPQLKEKEAALRSAMSELERAQLDLQRTNVMAPFASLVLEENVEEGSFVDSSAIVAKLASTDEFYVKVRIPDTAIQWIDFDDNSGLPSANNEVRVLLKAQEGTAFERSGTLERLLGSVDSAGRMAQLLISIGAPLTPGPKSLPVLLGTYVKVEITGKVVSDVYRIPRKAMREQNKIYVGDAKGLLRVRIPEIIYESEDSIVIKSGLQPDDKVVLSNIASPLEGMKLAVEEPAEAK